MSKLTLYKQAPSPNRKTLDNQSYRKPQRQGLAQGRLVEGENRSNVGIGTTTTARADEMARVGQPSLRPGDAPHIQLSSPCPSRDRPSMSYEHSPKPVRPSKALELSDDSDSDTQFYEGRKGEVLVVDASMDTKSARDTEVEVSVGLSRSPYKVVCHSPRAVHDSLREQSLLGSVEDAKAIAVDRVPTITLGGDSASADEDVARITQLLHQQKIVDRASPSGEGSRPARVPETAAQPRPMPNNRLFDQLMSHVSSDGDADESSLPLATDDVVTNSSKTVAKNKKQVDARTSGKAEKKKKKGTTVVASRYMQASASVKPKGPMKATDRTILTKSSSIMTKTSTTTTKKVRKASQLSKSARENSGLSTTPVLRGSSRHTSTPTERATTPLGADGSIFQGFDASAIAPAQQSHHSYSTPDGKALSRVRVQSKESSLGASGGHSTLSSTDSRSGYSSHHKQGNEVKQADLELLHARYLQWLFLNSSATKAFKEQEKQVMAQLYGLQEENEKLERRKAELDLLLAKTSHAHRLDEALDIQEEGLEPVVPSLGPLDQQHASLAAGLDTTRHQLAVAGVLVPEDQDTYSARLQAALGESEQLLGELATMCRHRQPDVTACAAAMNTLQHSLQEQADEMIRSQHLLETAEALAVEESSLLIQNSTET